MLHGNPEKDPSAVKLGDFGLGLIVDNDAAYSTYVGTVKEDIAPKGPDQHSRSMPRQSITGNALTLSYTPFEVTSPGKGPPRTDLPTNAKPTDDTKTDITTESSVLNEFREFRRQRRESPRREGGTEKRTELDITTESSVPFKWWWQKKEEQKE
ncbi:hypothetical protein LTR67_008796 [Exophiala xenobiotica]